MLFVCTANIIRSPTAEALLRHHLAGTGVGGRVRSAGLLEGGRAAAPAAVAALAQRGVDLSSHRSRRLGAEDVAAADLILGMEPRHVREAAVLADGAVERTFTLPEFVRRARAAGPRRPGEDLPTWLRRVAAGRRLADSFGRRRGDIVVDPLGGTAADYVRTAEELDQLVRQVVALLWVDGDVRPDPVAPPPPLPWS